MSTLNSPPNPTPNIIADFKAVETVLPPPPPHMVGDGFKVHNFFPGGHRLGKHRMSPFIMLDYGAKNLVPPSDESKGVGAHPHRGFETVTISFHGRVEHHDSAGNHGLIGEGDVQWMTAGSGILHKEFHEREFARSGGLVQMAQLWVNLPSRFKMTPPKYQELTRAHMGHATLPNGAGTVEIIAGEYQGVKGPASTFTPITLLVARIQQGKGADFAFPETWNTAAILADGSVTCNGEAAARENDMILFRNQGERIRIEATEDCTVLFMSGEPINEPIEAYGPFVMNTQAELAQAVTDYQQGKFGRLDD